MSKVICINKADFNKAIEMHRKSLKDSQYVEVKMSINNSILSMKSFHCKNGNSLDDTDNCFPYVLETMTPVVAIEDCNEIIGYFDIGELQKIISKGKINKNTNYTVTYFDNILTVEDEETGETFNIRGFLKEYVDSEYLDNINKGIPETNNKEVLSFSAIRTDEILDYIVPTAEKYEKEKTRSCRACFSGINFLQDESHGERVVASESHTLAELTTNLHHKGVREQQLLIPVAAFRGIPRNSDISICVDGTSDYCIVGTFFKITGKQITDIFPNIDGLFCDCKSHWFSVKKSDFYPVVRDYFKKSKGYSPFSCTISLRGHSAKICVGNKEDKNTVVEIPCERDGFADFEFSVLSKDFEYILKATEKTMKIHYVVADDPLLFISDNMMYSYAFMPLIHVPSWAHDMLSKD